MFFARQKDAIAKRNEIQAAVEARAYVPDRDAITVADAVARWLEGRRGDVKGRTLLEYEKGARYITGPLLVSATPAQRRTFNRHWSRAEGRVTRPYARRGEGEPSWDRGTSVPFTNYS